jgi:hypothetical protein
MADGSEQPPKRSRLEDTGSGFEGQPERSEYGSGISSAGRCAARSARRREGDPSERGLIATGFREAEKIGMLELRTLSREAEALLL